MSTKNCPHILQGPYGWELLSTEVQNHWKLSGLANFPMRKFFMQFYLVLI